MNKLIERYKELYLALQKGGKNIPPRERKMMITIAIRIEKLIIRKITRQMLSGAFTLDISQFPPRLQRLARMLLNRRLHIIHTLERQKKINMEMHKETQQRLNMLNQAVFFDRKKQIDRDSVGYLVKLQRYSEQKTNNGKKILEKIKQDLQR